MNTRNSDHGETGQKRVTIRDVAKEAQVSVAAVSKVIRHAYGVSPEMKSRVETVIADLGYRPRVGARTMRGRSNTIGVVLTELSSPFQAEVAQGIREGLEDTSFEEIIADPGGIDPDRQMHSIDTLLDRQVDGLVVIPPWVGLEYLERVAKQVPTVAVGLHGDTNYFDTVVDDDYAGACLVVEHLVNLGHRSIAFIGMPGASGYPSSFTLSHTRRLQGYEDSMMERGLSPRVYSTFLSEEGGYRAALKALASDILPTAIFAGADIAAFGVLRAAEERGLEIPRDLSVVGYDNIFASSIGRVSLTTVDQSGRQTGLASARLLLERIEGRKEPKRFVVPTKLIVRATSGDCG